MKTQSVSKPIEPQDGCTESAMKVVEEYGIITKQTFAEVPPRCEYTLTKKGEDLLPILQQMASWGTKYGQA